MDLTDMNLFPVREPASSAGDATVHTNTESVASMTEPMRMNSLNFERSAVAPIANEPSQETLAQDLQIVGKLAAIYRMNYEDVAKEMHAACVPTKLAA